MVFLSATGLDHPTPVAEVPHLTLIFACLNQRRNRQKASFAPALIYLSVSQNAEKSPLPFVFDFGQFPAVAGIS